MRIVKALIFVLSFGAIAGSVYAGEDTTYREHCVGRAFWELPGGVASLDQAQAECDAPVRG